MNDNLGFGKEQYNALLASSVLWHQGKCNSEINHRKTV